MATYRANPNGGESFGSKLKKFFTNKAVVVTLVTLLLAVGIIVAATVAANRSRKPVPGTDGTTAESASGTKPAGGLDVFKEDDTLPTYHGNDTQVEARVDDPAPLCFALPAKGQLIKGHDATVQVWSSTMGDYRVHLGVDISTAEAAPVMAAADGTIAKIWSDAMMGNCVAIDHGSETLTVYKNLSATLADGIIEGAAVKKGCQIGTVGDSAIAEMAEEPHLHFEVTVNGLEVDPLTFFDEADVAAMEDVTADDAFEESAAGK